MTIRFRAIPGHNLAILEHKGKILDEEFLSFYKELYESGDYNPSMNHLVDLREADSSSRSTDVLRDFAEFVRVRLTDADRRPKVAVVAPKDISFGLARVYDAYADAVPWDFVIFRSIEAALAWLGLSGDALNGEDRSSRDGS